jgi:hypothetical protein
VAPDDRPPSYSGAVRESAGTRQPAGFVLWFKPDRRGPWQKVGNADTRVAALRLMDGSGYRNGKWMVLPVSDRRFLDSKTE